MPDPMPEEVIAAGLLGLVLEAETPPNALGQHGPLAWFVSGWCRGKKVSLGSYVPGTGHRGMA